MYNSRLAKPKVSEVNEWILNEDLSNPSVNVYYADIDAFFFRAVGKGIKTKYFYGETAWQDARRYADDNHRWTW